MKVIVIAGGGRHVGKTTLAFALIELLPDSRVVKLGEHPKRSDKPSFLMPLHASYVDILEAVPKCEHLVLESGSILDDPDLNPDLVIFLPTADGRADKPGSDRRRSRADLVRGEIIIPDATTMVSEKLGVSTSLSKRILEAIERPV